MCLCGEFSVSLLKPQFHPNRYILTHFLQHHQFFSEGNFYVARKDTNCCGDISRKALLASHLSTTYTVSGENSKLTKTSKRSWGVSSDTAEVKTQTVSSEKGRSHMRTIPACMYFSSCSRRCSTSAGVSVKIFFGGKAGTTVLPYSFFICWYKTHVVKGRLWHRRVKLVICLILAALNQRNLIFFFPHHIPMCENQTWPFSWPKHLSSEEQWLKLKRCGFCFLKGTFMRWITGLFQAQV